MEKCGWDSRERLPEAFGDAAVAFPNGDNDERPFTWKNVGAFEMGQTEVTNAQFEAFGQHRQFRGRLNFSKDDSDAVLFVSYHDAIAYCEWLTETFGRTMHPPKGDTDFLPTEVEWEYAARGNDTRTVNSYFWTGDSIPDDMLNNNGKENCGMPKQGWPTKVARISAEWVRIYDTIGNVEEWTSTAYAAYDSSMKVKDDSSERDAHA